MERRKEIAAKALATRRANQEAKRAAVTAAVVAEESRIAEVAAKRAAFIATPGLLFDALIEIEALKTQVATLREEVDSLREGVYSLKNPPTGLWE